MTDVAFFALGGCGSRRDYDIDLELDELGSDFGETLVTSLAIPILDRDIATFDPTEFVQSLDESGGPLAHDRRRARS
jgi:hypothetical protein